VLRLADLPKHVIKQRFGGKDENSDKERGSQKAIAESTGNHGTGGGTAE
jgi:hypothetical protein